MQPRSKGLINCDLKLHIRYTLCSVYQFSFKQCPLLFLLYTLELFPSWSVKLMTPLWWLLSRPQASELQLLSPWSVTLAGLVSGVTFGELNWINWRSLMTLLYWEWHLIPWWPLRSIFARFPEQLLKDLVSWGSPGGCFLIDRFLEDDFEVL